MASDNAVIRAATWNVWWLFGEQWHRRERGIVATLEQWHPDVFGFQEAWAFGDRTQADALAEELGMHSAFVEPGLPVPPNPVEHPDQIGVRVGLGLLSRWSITRAVPRELPSPGATLVAMQATIAHPLGDLHVIVAGTSGEPEHRAAHAAQLAALGDMATDPVFDGPLPVLLLADLNADFENESMHLLRQRLVDTWGTVNHGIDPRTLSATNRFAPPDAELQFNRRVDHVMARAGRADAPVVVRSSWITRDEFEGLPPSDHYPVFTDFEV